MSSDSTATTIWGPARGRARVGRFARRVPRGPTSGVPLGLNWSGPDPYTAEWWLARPSDCRYLYEIVLPEGALDDVRALIDDATVDRVWEDLYLLRHIRHAWQPLMNRQHAGAHPMPLDPLQERLPDHARESLRHHRAGDRG